MKFISLFLFIFAVRSVFAAQIEIYRRTENNVEKFTLDTVKGQEVLSLNSNFFQKQNLEFGSYTRAATDLDKELKRINSLKRPYKDRRARTPNLFGWNVLIAGKDVDPKDPRFDAVMQMVTKRVTTGKWRKTTATVFSKQSPKITAKTINYPAVGRPTVTQKDYNVLKSCEAPKVGQLICRFPSGTLYIPKSKMANAPKSTKSL